MTVRTIAMLLLAAALPVLWGCGESRTYREGVLAESYRMMSSADLERYLGSLTGEIGRVEAGGAVPAEVTREVYLEDLRRRRQDVEEQIRGNARRQAYERHKTYMDLMYGY